MKAATRTIFTSVLLIACGTTFATLAMFVVPETSMHPRTVALIATGIMWGLLAGMAALLTILNARPTRRRRR